MHVYIYILKCTSVNYINLKDSFVCVKSLDQTGDRMADSVDFSSCITPCSPAPQACIIVHQMVEELE